MKFYKALESIESGHFQYMRMKRWSPEVVIFIHTPTDEVSHQFLCVRSRFGTVPWIPTQVEMFSSDWEIK